MPDYSNEVTRKVEANLLPLEYNLKINQHIMTINKGPCELGDGTVYHGEWVCGRPNGKGV